MLIIIEGPDKAGKTTLAREIADRFGYDYVHFGPPGPDPAGDYAKFLLNLKKPTVCDRFLYGELVYGPLLRGKSVITPLQKTVLERLCRLRGALLIHASAPLQLINDRILKLGDDMITIEQNTGAYYAFNKVMEEATIRPFGQYTSTDNRALDGIIDNLVSVMDILKYTGKVASQVCTGIGTVLGSKTVIVGEELNQNITWIKKPFDRGSCSEFLNDCLKKSTINESRVYVVNAATLRIPEVLFLFSTGCTNWIALGKKATELLSGWGISHDVLPHPQYQKRFKSSETESYIKQLSSSGCKCIH